jgi:hypothetical protein
MQAVYTTRKNMAQSWRQRATRMPQALRVAVGANTSLVFQKRGEIMDETIYDRSPTERPLSGDLRKGERVRMRGNVAEISNVEPYAQRRNDATGRSKTYGHDLTSDFAGRAVRETAAERRANVKRALRVGLSDGGR